MKLIEVNGPKLQNEVIEVPKRLYKNDPEYIMPLDNDIKAVFDKSKNQNTVIAWDRNTAFSEHFEVLKTKIPAHASYTNTDSGLVINDLDQNNEPALYLVQLRSDKVSLKSGISPLKIVDERENPKWFTLGNRVGIPASKTDLQNIDLFPNPVLNKLNIQGVSDSYSYEIYNSLGQMVLKNRSNQRTAQLDVRSLYKGTYHISIISPEGIVQTQLFIKQ